MLHAHTGRDACDACTQDTETSSHLQLDYDEDGNPEQLRFVYVAMSKKGLPVWPANTAQTADSPRLAEA